LVLLASLSVVTRDRALAEPLHLIGSNAGTYIAAPDLAHGSDDERADESRVTCQAGNDYRDAELLEELKQRAASKVAARTCSGKETHMGMFDGLLGGLVGAGMVSVLNNIVEKHGGLQGVVNEFEKNGLGATVKSWVGTGPNQPISPDDVQKTLGPDLLQQLSQKSGLSMQDLTKKLSQILPQAVDKLTPDGTIPKV
jgi:uncharacterized protein YidB (DUF937 family)